MVKLEAIKDIREEYDTSFYIYDEEVISRQVDKLLGNFSDFEFLYSIKTNPFEPVVDYLVFRGFGADAASAEEVMIARRAGLSYEKILYSSPGKTRRDIEKTIDKAIIIADSYNELALIDKIAQERDIHIRVGLRINMDFSMDGGQGTSSQFGVDESSLKKHKDLFNSLENTQISGIHVHLRSQVLDYRKLYNYYEKIFELAVFCVKDLAWEMDFINFGGGLGIVYSQENQEDLDLEKLAEKSRGLIQKFKDDVSTRLIIETGRFVICEAGTYVSPIVDIKESMGRKYIIVEKALNGFLRPAIKELLINYGSKESLKTGSEPIYTTKDAFDFIIPEADYSRMEEVTIVGRLCTATDSFAKNIQLPKAKIGDTLLVTKAGSYAYSLSPHLFASYDPPLQFYIKESGEIKY